MSDEHAGRHPQPDWLDEVADQLTAIARTIDKGMRLESPMVRDDYDDRRSQIHPLLLILDCIQAFLTERHNFISETDEVAYYRLQAPRYASIAADARGIAEFLAVMGVTKNALSRVYAGQILGVHQGTIARWVKEFREHGQLTMFARREYPHHRTLDLKKQMTDDRVDSDDE